MTTMFDDSYHPLVVPANTDPLISPTAPAPTPPPPLPKNPNSDNYSHIEPLTYTDVNSMPPNTNGEELQSAKNPRGEFEGLVPVSTPPSQSYLKITVSNPQKEVESSTSIVPGSNTYVMYLITTKTNMSEFGGLQFTVRRRFKDVVTLSDRVMEAYRGFLYLQGLQRLVEHPVIRQSGELRAFLQVQGKLPLLPNSPVTLRMLDGATKSSKQLLGDNLGGGSVRIQPQDVVRPAKSKWDFLRIVKEMNQSVNNN